MKRALLTNLYIQKYTGSEFHILEIAKLFQVKGYQVTVATFEKAYPMLELFEEFEIETIECRTEELKETEYDIMFVQHFPVLDYLVSRYDLKCNQLIVSKLGIQNIYEELPVCAKDADLISCVSEECAEVVRQSISPEKVFVFKNCVNEAFFSVYAEKKNRILRKIAVISNHIPQELREIKEKEKWEIVYYGIENAPRLIDEKALQEFDLVISIGRTVQLCFAAGIPIYVYDYFGGPGYITKENLLLAEKHNFSGRGFPSRTTEQIIEEIESGYAKAKENLPDLHERAKEEYSYKIEFEKMYKKLQNIETKEIKKLCYYDEAGRNRIRAYAELLADSEVIEKNDFSQIYADYGKGYEEKDSIKWKAKENHNIKKSIKLEGAVKSIRLDPCNQPCRCKIHKVTIDGIIHMQEITALNAVKIEGEEAFFLTEDPQYLLYHTISEEAKEIGEIEIIYSWRPLEEEQKETLITYINQMQEKERKRIKSTIKRILRRR